MERALEIIGLPHKKRYSLFEIAKALEEREIDIFARALITLKKSDLSWDEGDASAESFTTDYDGLLQLAMMAKSEKGRMLRLFLIGAENEVNRYDMET